MRGDEGEGRQRREKGGERRRGGTRAFFPKGVIGRSVRRSPTCQIPRHVDTAPRACQAVKYTSGHTIIDNSPPSSMPRDNDVIMSLPLRHRRSHCERQTFSPPSRRIQRGRSEHLTRGALCVFAESSRFRNASSIIPQGGLMTLIIVW